MHMIVVHVCITVFSSPQSLSHPVPPALFFDDRPSWAIIETHWYWPRGGWTCVIAGSCAVNEYHYYWTVLHPSTLIMSQGRRKTGSPFSTPTRPQKLVPRRVLSYEKGLPVESLELQPREGTLTVLSACRIRKPDARTYSATSECELLAKRSHPRAPASLAP